MIDYVPNNFYVQPKNQAERAGSDLMMIRERERPYPIHPFWGVHIQQLFVWKNWGNNKDFAGRGRGGGAGFRREFMA